MLLELEDVAVEYGRIEALHGISITINDAATLSLSSTAPRP